MKKKKDSDVGLVFLIMLMVGLVLAVMGLVFCVIKLKEEKAKNNELTSKQNNDAKTVYVVPEDEEEIEEEEIPEEEPKEENETEKVEENKSEELSFEELMNKIYPNSTGNFSKKYSYVTVDCSYDGNESEIWITIDENDYGEKVIKKRICFVSGPYENRTYTNLEEKVVDLYIAFNPENKIYSIDFLTEKGNVYSIPWMWTYEEYAQLIGVGKDVIRLVHQPEAGIDKDGNTVELSEVYADGL